MCYVCDFSQEEEEEVAVLCVCFLFGYFQIAFEPASQKKNRKTEKQEKEDKRKIMERQTDGKNKR